MIVSSAKSSSYPISRSPNKKPHNSAQMCATSSFNGKTQIFTNITSVIHFICKASTSRSNITGRENSQQMRNHDSL